MPSMTQTVAALVLALTVLGQPQAMPLVIFETEKGNIEIEVDTRHAPLSAANFLRIQASSTGARGPYGPESLDPPIKILKAYRR